MVGSRIAEWLAMQSRPLFMSRIRRKATWGARVAVLPSLLLVFAFLFLPIAADAALRPTAADARQTDAADRKLDAELRRRATEGAGESDIIVEFNDALDDSDVIRGFGTKGRRLGIINGRVLRVPNGLLKKLAAHPRVKKISHDRAAQGDVGRTAVTIGSRAVVDLMGYNGAGIGVAVIDSGITPFHDDLRLKPFGTTQPSLLTLTSTALALTGQLLTTNQRVAHFKDFVNGRTTPYDDWGHGTHVSGIVAGNGYDSWGVREAIAPGAHIISLKALAADGSGRISNIIAAIDYAVTNRAKYNIRVINMSLGARVVESYNTDPLTVAAKRAVEAGVVVVASAGNMGKAADGSAQYGAIGAPGNAPWVLTVGASSTMGDADRRNDQMAPYSSRGPTRIDYAAKPDLVAPGTGTVAMSAPLSRMYIEKTQFLVSGLISGLTSKPYLTLSGTSMSAPVVAGTVALMLHANPSLTPNMVKAMLQFTAQVYPGYDYMTQGAGFLNARGAVVLAEYFKTGGPGDRYPRMRGWSRHLLWGNTRVSGGVLTPNGTAWANNIVWGESSTPTGQNIVWGENCDTNACDNIVWGNNIVWGDDGDDNIVWGNTDGDNIVWGNSDGDNIVWGNGDSDNIVWGESGGDNIVWGEDCAGANCDNIVWGEAGADNIVWGNAEGIDNIVWGENDDNIVWGNSAEDLTFGDDTSELETFDSSVWDDLFEIALPSELVMPTTGTTSATTIIGGLIGGVN
jgi:serine protease AprX